LDKTDLDPNPFPGKKVIYKLQSNDEIEAELWEDKTLIAQGNEGGKEKAD